MRRSQKMIAVILLLTLMSSLCVYSNDHSIIENRSLCKNRMHSTSICGMKKKFY